jgi:O-antigen/teichoic acid export membrane protein
MLDFSRPFLPASIFFILIELSDRWMLGWLSDLDNVGLYGVGYKIGAIMLLLVRAFNLSWQPFYLKHADCNRQFESIGTKLIISMVYIATLLSISWPFFLKIQINEYYLIGKQFWDGGMIIPIISISYIFYGIFILQMPSLYLKNKQSWVPYFWGIGFMFNFLGNYILIPQCGYLGAAIATLLSYLSMSLLLVYKNQSWMPIRYHMKPIILMAFISTLAYLFSQSYSNIIISIIFIYFLFGINYIYYIQKKL